MAGYDLVIKLNQLQQNLAQLGFKLAKSKFHDINYAAIMPLNDDALPVYARDTDIYCGTLDEIEVWVRGAMWARDYDKMIKLSNQEKRERKEQDVRNQILVTELSK